ncbi:hypothetical protein BV20DRAFT_537213 [Pilatotrama ljubarskyi]|nr:hypothetical protein BV20DRAFT_537213 [Pilatotrama ljubarskyi]
MIIRNVPVRHQTALLKPECIELKGYLIADRDKNRDALLYRALKARLGEPVEEPLPAPAPSPPPGPAQEPRSPLREITPPLAAADAGPSNSPRRAEREHDDDAGQPRRRKRPSRAGRSPSPDPPPREAVLQRSRYFSKPTSGLNNLATVSNGAPSGGVDAEVDMEDDVGRVRVDSGDADAMQNLARAIGLSPARPAPAHVPLKEDDSDDDPLAPSSNGHPGANGKGKGKGKQRAEPVFGEPASDDYGFEFEMDDSFLEQVDRAEQEALLRAAAANLDSRTNGSQSQSQTHVGSAQTHVRTRTQIKAEPQSQYTTTTTSKTLFSTAAAGTAGTQRPVPRPIPRAGSAAAGPGTSSSGSGADVPMDVIDISDDDVEDKENVPVPTRHVRRRVALPVDADVIELSD